jgi:hypothetical protein
MELRRRCLMRRTAFTTERAEDTEKFWEKRRTLSGIAACEKWLKLKMSSRAKPRDDIVFSKSSNLSHCRLATFAFAGINLRHGFAFHDDAFCERPA